MCISNDTIASRVLFVNFWNRFIAINIIFNKLTPRNVVSLERPSKKKENGGNNLAWSNVLNIIT